MPLDGAPEPGVQKSVVCQDWAGVARDEGDAAAAWLATFMQSRRGWWANLLSGCAVHVREKLRSATYGWE